jgi:hypothetical protein
MSHIARGLLLLLGSLLVLGAAACDSEPEVDGRTVTEWIGLLRHQDWEVQQEAQDALARLGTEAVPYLKRSLRFEDPTLRRGLVRTLAQIGPPAADTVPMLLSVISREKVAVIRAAILRALAAIAPRDEDVRAEFKRRLRDVDPDVRRAARAGLDKAEAAAAPQQPAEPAAGGQADAGPAVEAPRELELRGAVAEILAAEQPGVAFALVAEVERGKRRAAIVWPGMKAGRVLDDDLVAWVFERRGEDDWRRLQQVGPLRSDAPVVLSEALGGADDQQVVRPCGVAREELASYLAEHGAAFARAREAGDGAAAMRAFEQLSRAFSFGLVAHGDQLTEMALKGAFDQPWQIDTADPGARVPVVMRAGDESVSGRLELRPCGGGVVIGAIEPAAAPADAGTPKPGPEEDAEPADQGAADQGAADQGAADEGTADEGTADEGAADEGGAHEPGAAATDGK